MSAGLRLGVLLTGLFLLFLTLGILRRGKIPTKFALVWLVPTLIILLVSIWPGLLVRVANFMGFLTISNFVIGMLIVLIICIIMSLTVIISDQARKITRLIQEVSILKNQTGHENEE